MSISGSESKDSASEPGTSIFPRENWSGPIPRRSLFGVARDKPVTYELFLSLLEPKDRERTEQAIKRVAETGGNFDVSFRVGGDVGTRSMDSRPRRPDQG